MLFVKNLKDFDGKTVYSKKMLFGSSRFDNIITYVIIIYVWKFNLLWTFSGDYAGTQGLGLLRLHSTYRHDLKIYASDEGISLITPHSKEYDYIIYMRSSALSSIGHGNRDHATSSKRGRLERFTT